MGWFWSKIAESRVVLVGRGRVVSWQSENKPQMAGTIGESEIDAGWCGDFG